jgi:hypothetical protein
VWRQVALALLGVTLITLGLLDYHVQVGAVLVGAGLLGLVSVDSVLDAYGRSHRR